MDETGREGKTNSNGEGGGRGNALIICTPSVVDVASCRISSVAVLDVTDGVVESSEVVDVTVVSGAPSSEASEVTMMGCGGLIAWFAILVSSGARVDEIAS
jgi:hypothetical protein